MKTKDQQLLEEAYLSIYKLKENNSLETSLSPETINQVLAFPRMNPQQDPESVKSFLIGKYVTVYQTERTQGYANKSDLPPKEIKAGERLNSTSEVTGRKVVAAGRVEDIELGSSEQETVLKLDTDPDQDSSEDLDDNNRGRLVEVKFGLGRELEVRKDPVSPVSHGGRFPRDRFSRKK